MLGDAFFNYKLTDAAVKHLDTLTCPIYFFIFSVDGEFNFLRPHRLPGKTNYVIVKFYTLFWINGVSNYQ